jgi:hypothetical protein
LVKTLVENFEEANNVEKEVLSLAGNQGKKTLRPRLRNSLLYLNHPQKEILSFRIKIP